MKKKILILAGGYSKEREISLLTAKSVFRELKKTKKYRLKIADPSFGFVSLLKKYKPNNILIHDAARPDFTIKLLRELLELKEKNSLIEEKAIHKRL